MQISFIDIDETLRNFQPTTLLTTESSFSGERIGGDLKAKEPNIQSGWIGKEEINLLNWTITCNLVYFWKHLLVMVVVLLRRSWYHPLLPFHSFCVHLRWFRWNIGCDGRLALAHINISPNWLSFFSLLCSILDITHHTFSISHDGRSNLELQWARIEEKKKNIHFTD